MDTISVTTVVTWVVMGLSAIGGSLGMKMLTGIKSDIKLVAENQTKLSQTMSDHTAEFKELKGFLKGKGYDL